MVHRIFGGCGLLLLLAGLLAGQTGPAAGTYKGQWTGASAGGDIHITFRDGLAPEVGFTLGGEDVTCKILSFKIDGAKFTMVYEFDAQGNMLQSALEATVKGKT